ncbi:M15 family metallopeptidase [Nocardioides sp. R1-1]|uniref:M15 family metallopeptidase n=1 Tax=Nocardioides sp. R1-1 TaxID=3383502 RepID=UPI0038D03079
MKRLTSQNGWPVLLYGSDLLHTWTIPAKSGAFTIRLRNGSAGFLLAHFLLWFADTIEKVLGPQLDDWGHAVRPVRGQVTGYSNHASATAFDVNSLRHPLGKRGTYARWQYLRMRARLALYRGCIRLGIDYRNRPDEMHGEINKPLPACERVARRLIKTKRGRQILAANPGQRAVILS